MKSSFPSEEAVFEGSVQVDLSDLFQGLFSIKTISRMYLISEQIADFPEVKFIKKNSFMIVSLR